MELVGGDGPDLFKARNIGREECVSYGLIEDLVPWLEKSNVLSRDLLVEQVMELCTVDEILTTIPVQFSISTLWTTEDVAGADPGWTQTEFIECLKNNYGASVLEQNVSSRDSRDGILMLLWNANRNTWIDWKEKKAHFDSSEFKELLSYVAAYKAKYDSETYVFFEDYIDKWLSGHSMVFQNSSGHLVAHMRFLSYVEEPITAKGFPTEGGEPCNVYSKYRRQHTANIQ